MMPHGDVLEDEAPLCGTGVYLVAVTLDQQRLRRIADSRPEQDL